jgi:hypothetical protein
MLPSRTKRVTKEVLRLFIQVHPCHCTLGIMWRELDRIEMCLVRSEVFLSAGSVLSESPRVLTTSVLYRY